MINYSIAEQSFVVFGDNSRWLRICLFMLFFLAALNRLDDIRAPGHLLDREYTSAIFARAFYYATADGVESWRREIAVTQKNQQPVLEPPVLEYMVSYIYRVMGREEIYFARYLTNSFWLIGGAFMFLIARKLLSTDEALVATAYYLFVPMGIIISRSFQPDSLMMMLYLFSLYLMVHYSEKPTVGRLFGMAIVTGITLLLRPLVIFSIFCAFLAFSFHRHQNWRRLIDSPLMIFGSISILPFLVYYGYGILFAGFMRWKLSTSFMPYLLTKEHFWVGWLDNVLGVAEFAPLVFAVAGLFLLKQGVARHLVLALIVAFMMFSIAFTYHIHTHPYYHIQLFPIVGLCMAPAVVKSTKSLMQAVGRAWWMPAIVIVFLALFAEYREVRDSLYTYRMENPVVAQEIGKVVNHSSRTAYVAFYYGLPLAYYGEFGGAPWPVRISDEFYRRPGARELSVEERLQGLGFIPEYFVITHFELFNKKHQDLRAYLESNCRKHAQASQYLVYNACQHTYLASPVVSPPSQPTHGRVPNHSPASRVMVGQ